MNKNLSELRSEIDRLDRSIVAMINERYGYERQVGEWKHANASEMYVPEREKALLEKLEGIIDKSPKTPLKYSDQVAAIKLLAQVTGLLDTNKKEEHLHIHADQVPFADEASLRKQLSIIQEEKMSKPIDVIDG